MRRGGVIGLLAMLAALFGAPNAVLATSGPEADPAAVASSAAHDVIGSAMPGETTSGLLTVLVALGLTGIGGVALISLALMITGWRRGRAGAAGEGRAAAGGQAGRRPRPEPIDDPIVSAMRLGDSGMLPRARDFPPRPGTGDPPPTRGD